MKKQLALATILAAALAAGSVHAQSAGQATEAQSSESIRMMQQALQNEGYQIQVDGVWGPNTQQALDQFQERQQQMGMSGQTAATPDSSAPASTLGTSGAGMGTATSPGLSGTGTSGAGIDSSPTGTVDSPQTAQERGWDRAGGIDSGSDSTLGTGAGETGVGGSGAGGGAGGGAGQ